MKPKKKRYISLDGPYTLTRQHGSDVDVFSVLTRLAAYCSFTDLTLVYEPMWG